MRGRLLVEMKNPKVQVPCLRLLFVSHLTTKKTPKQTKNKNKKCQVRVLWRNYYSQIRKSIQAFSLSFPFIQV